MPMPAFAPLERVEAGGGDEVCEGGVMNERVSERVLNEVEVVREMGIVRDMRGVRGVRGMRGSRGSREVRGVRAVREVMVVREVGVVTKLEVLEFVKTNIDSGGCQKIEGCEGGWVKMKVVRVDGDLRKVLIDSSLENKMLFVVTEYSSADSADSLEMISVPVTTFVPITLGAVLSLVLTREESLSDRKSMLMTRGSMNGSEAAISKRPVVIAIMMAENLMGRQNTDIWRGADIAVMMAEDSTVDSTSLLKMISEPVTIFVLVKESIVVSSRCWTTCVFFPIATTSTLFSNLEGSLDYDGRKEEARKGFIA